MVGNAWQRLPLQNQQTLRRLNQAQILSFFLFPPSFMSIYSPAPPATNSLNILSICYYIDRVLE